MSELSLNSEYLAEPFLSTWKKNSGHLDDSNLFFDPFRCFALPNFLHFDTTVSHKQFFSELRNELSKIEYFEKHNDLYKFRQSDDFKRFTNSPILTKVRELFLRVIRDWLIELTGIPLNTLLDLTVSDYRYTDHLLCHDDELDDRRIAFILYLTEEWSVLDGGSLDLLRADDHNRPTTVVKSILPLENMFVFFEVAPNSYHQVSEILAKDKIRLSLNGWFHGPPIERHKIAPELALTYDHPCFIEYSDLISWINPVYLDPDRQSAIRKKFEQESQIELRNFLQEIHYEAVLKSLEKASGSNVWIHRGPANKRNYESFHMPAENSTDDTSRSPINACLRLLKSEAMFLILSQLTGLKLHPLYECTSDDEDTEPCASKRAKVTSSSESSSEIGENRSGCTCEVRRWSHGSYTLLNDEVTDTTASAATSLIDESEQTTLDVQLFFGWEDWRAEYGGYTCYVEKGEDNELLTVVPRSNSLTVVCRDAETVRFVKYINHRAIDATAVCAKDKHMYDLALVYAEDPDEFVNDNQPIMH